MELISKFLLLLLCLQYIINTFVITSNVVSKMKANFLIIIFLGLSFFQKLSAQDIIYTTSGVKISAKVVEISPSEIKYKQYENMDGPNYVIQSRDVVLINFSNGTSQIINANAPTLKPKKEELPIIKPKDKLPENLYYMNPNLVSINALGLLNGDITLTYDRELLKSHLMLTALGSYNINQSINKGFNLYINEAGGNAKKNFDIGFGINFLPQNTKRTQYFVGLLGKYMSYNYEEYEYIAGQGSVLKLRAGAQTAVMITNGWLMRVTPHFNLKIFGSAGFASHNPPINLNGNSSQGNIVLPKFYFGYCFGYRF